MKALASAIVAAAMLVVGAGGVGHAWASPASAQVKVRAWNQRGGWGGGPRGGWGGPRVGWGVGWGFGWGARPWWGPGWYGYPAYPYAYAPYAYPPAVVVQPNPQVYIEQAPQAQPPAPPVMAQPQGPNYWYYCGESRTYYPYVRECPGGWMTVVPPSSSSP